MVVWVKPPEGFKHDRRPPQAPHWENNKARGNLVIEDEPVMDWREGSQLPADFVAQYETEDDADAVWGEMTVEQRAVAWGMVWDEPEKWINVELYGYDDAEDDYSEKSYA